jgi:NADPH:quinone reductase-like Zn-dependent oxidoreductase
MLGIPLLTPLQLMNSNRTVSGVNIGHLWGQSTLLREELQAVLALWDQGRIKPRIDASYPFTEAAAAHAGSCNDRTSARSCLNPEPPPAHTRAPAPTTRGYERAFVGVGSG